MVATNSNSHVSNIAAFSLLLTLTPHAAAAVTATAATHNGHFNDEMHTPATIFGSKRTSCLGFLTETRPRLGQPTNAVNTVQTNQPA